jgi:hypothetical protein
LQREIIGPEYTSLHAFITPPFLAWLYVPFSAIPYLWSFTLWSFLGLIGLGVSLRWLGYAHPQKPFLWALTWFPIFASISFGQNSLLSLTLLSLTYLLWRQERTFASGLVCSLLLFKPQLALGIGLLWLLRWRYDWKALLGLSLGGGMLAALSFGFLPEASQRYLGMAPEFFPSLITQEGFPIWHSVTIRGFWQLLFPGSTALAEVLSLPLAVGGIGAFILFWTRNREQKPRLFAAAICLTMWITPHAMIYDWALLLIPAVLLWKDDALNQKLLRVLFAILWVASIVSGPFTVLQLRMVSRAVQISMPIFLFVMTRIWLAFMRPKLELTHTID